MSLWLVPVLGLAAWVRVNVYPRVLVGGQLRPADADSEYHLSRILEALQEWPRISVFDRLLAWPRGHTHVWSPLFDWCGAAWVLLVGGPNAETRALAAALFPVVLGLLTVWVVIDLTRRLAPEAPNATGFLAGLFVALGPQFVACSRLARDDHHVWEALSVALLASWIVRRFDPLRGWRFELFGAFAVFAAAGGFVGGLLYVGIVACLLPWAALREPGPVVGSGAPALVLGGLGVLLLDAGPMLEHGQAMSFRVPSLLQPLAILLLASVCLWAVLSSRRLASAALGKRLLVFAGGLAVLVASALASPGLGAQLRAGLSGWLFKSDPWLAGVSEFQPLFRLGRPPIDALLYYLGVPGLLSAPLLALALLQRERPKRQALFAFAWIFGVLAALTMLQMRFGRVLSPLAGAAVALGASSLVARYLAEGPRRALALVGLGVLVIGTDAESRRELVLAPPRSAAPIEEAVDLLTLGDHLASPGRGEGVLAPWDLGSTLVSLAHRPVIACGFGTYVDPEGFALAKKALWSDERTLLQVMEQRDLGFVVTGAASYLKETVNGQTLLIRDETGRGFVNASFLEAVPTATMAFGGSSSSARVPHLEHLMPLGASTDLVQPLAWALPVLWVYERVPGADLRGQAEPGSRVEAQLEGTVGDRPFSWHAWTTAGADGRFNLRLAVPSAYRGHAFTTGRSWVLQGAGLAAAVAIPEAAVRAGTTIEVSP